MVEHLLKFIGDVDNGEFKDLLDSPVIKPEKKTLSNVAGPPSRSSGQSNTLAWITIQKNSQTNIVGDYFFFSGL